MAMALALALGLHMHACGRGVSASVSAFFYLFAVVSWNCLQIVLILKGTKNRIAIPLYNPQKSTLIEQQQQQQQIGTICGLRFFS